MGENDFFVGIQAILLKAHEDGWPAEKVIDKAYQAISEFEEEYGSDPLDEFDPVGEERNEND